MSYNILTIGRSTGNFRLKKNVIIILISGFLVGCPAPYYDITVTDSRSESLTVKLWEGSRDGKSKIIGPAKVLNVTFGQDVKTQNVLATLWEIEPINTQSNLSPHVINAVALSELTYGEIPNGFKQTQAPAKLQPGTKIYIDVNVLGGTPVRKSVQVR
jgi:hypothetical protein